MHNLATGVTYTAKYIGFEVWGVFAVPNAGPDILIGTTFDNETDARVALNFIKTGYKHGKMMEARRIHGKLIKAANFEDE